MHTILIVIHLLIVIALVGVRVIVWIRRLACVAVSHGPASVTTRMRIVTAAAPCAPWAWAAEEVLP